MRKHWEKPEPGRILIFKEKHCTRYFDASTKKKIEAAALKLLKERTNLKYGYIRKPDSKPYFYPKDIEVTLTLTDEQIAAIPTEDLRKQATDYRASARRAVREHQQEIETWQRVQQALKSKDGAAAWEILEAREDHEYEGFEFDSLEDTDD